MTTPAPCPYTRPVSPGLPRLLLAGVVALTIGVAVPVVATGAALVELAVQARRRARGAL